MTRHVASRPDDAVFPLPDSRYEGLTLRQLFVAAALAGLLARKRDGRGGRQNSEEVAELAVRMADRTLERFAAAEKMTG